MSDYKEYGWKADGKNTSDGSDKGKHADGGGSSGCMVAAPAVGIAIGTLVGIVKVWRR